jgi:V8-like Glu-specific endopeptidase
MQWNQSLTNLNELFAGMVPFKQESYALALKAGLRVENISFSDKPNTNWFYIIQQAYFEEKVTELIQVVEDTFGESPTLSRAKLNLLDAILGPESRVSLPVWHETDPDQSALEKIIGRENTLLPIHFLEVGLRVSQSVARIVTPMGIGTGFLIAHNILITNNHVIDSEDAALLSYVEFNYQKSAKGLDLKTTKTAFQPGEFFLTSEEDDWTAVKLIGDQNKHWGTIPIAENQIEKNQRVSIIQHPGGGEKQIALHHNYVRYADERIIQYLTDTLNGSSGAPVFDKHWNIIAVHHAGGYIRDPNSKRTVFRNEGIHINRVIGGLKTGGYKFS